MTPCPSCGATSFSRVVLTTSSTEGDTIRRCHCRARDHRLGHELDKRARACHS